MIQYDLGYISFIITPLNQRRKYLKCNKNKHIWLKMNLFGCLDTNLNHIFSLKTELSKVGHTYSAYCFNNFDANFARLTYSFLIS